MKNYFLKLIISIAAIIIVSTSCKKTDEINPPLTDRTLYLDSLSTLSTDLPTAHFTDLFFTSENTGYAVTGGLIVKTINGGINWSRKSITMSLMKKIQFTDSQTGYIIGENEGQGYVLLTKDAGNTWKPIKLDLIGLPNGMFFINNNTGFITGQNSFLKTTDGGITWTKIKTDEDLYFSEVNFKNTKDGIATASKGIYFKTIDGGITWESVQTPYSVLLKEIYFNGSKTLVSVASDKMIDLNNNFSVVTKPMSAYKQIYLSPEKSIGIGGHYDQGFWSYGDVFVTNNGWIDYKQKTFSIKEAISFGAIAKMSESKIMILGLGIPDTKVLIFKR
jgi:Photosynthesis system II assembly factor YCF48